MPKPIPVKLVLKILKKEGFLLVAKKGSHAKYRKPGTPTHNVTVKVTKKEIPFGTFHSILIQSGLQETDFRDGKK